MADRNKDIRLFERAATQRLKAAWFLFSDEAKQFNLDATYLAGYTVECALKAYILKQTPKNELAATMQKLTEVGAIAHDFEYLKAVLKDRLRNRSARDQDIFGKLTASLQKVARWSPDLRYQVGFLKTKQTAPFLQAAQEILNWCKSG